MKEAIVGEKVYPFHTNWVFCLQTNATHKIKRKCDNIRRREIQLMLAVQNFTQAPIEFAIRILPFLYFLFSIAVRENLSYPFFVLQNVKKLA